MADTEDKEKAEKLAAARKRFEQLKKQKAKKAGGAAKPAKEETKEKPAPADAVQKEDAAVEDSNAATSADAPSEAAPAETVRTSHGRQPSLSVQSRLRSDSFRRAAGSVGAGSGSNGSSSAIASPSASTGTSSINTAVAGGSWPSISSPESDAVQDIYRKQAARIELLERENKRMERELSEQTLLLQKSEAELQELQEGMDDVGALRAKADKADAGDSEIGRLKAEISSLERQNAHLQSSASKRRSSFSPASGADGVADQLAAKTSTIEALELEISKLRHQVTTSTTQNATLTTRVETLESSLQQAEQRAENVTNELSSLKANLEATSAKEGSDRSSAETRIILLESDLSSAQKAASDAVTRAAGLEKKIEALRTLHKESEARTQSQTNARQAESDRLKKEANELRTKLSTVSNENARLREKSSALGRLDAQGDDGGVDELEDEARAQLVARIRDLESENADLRRGIWRDRRRELQPGVDELDSPGAGAFDEVDLSGPASATPYQQPPLERSRSGQNYPSAFSTVLGAFTGQRGSNSYDQQQQQLISNRTRRDTQASGFLSDDGSMNFDEDAFRQAQEQEAQARLERVRELKRGLTAWKGWRLDLVESRGGAMAGVFDV